MCSSEMCSANIKAVDKTAVFAYSINIFVKEKALNGKSICHKRIREGVPPAESIPGRV